MQQNVDEGHPYQSSMSLMEVLTFSFASQAVDFGTLTQDALHGYSHSHSQPQKASLM